jgi:hypothetical protein
MAKCKHPRLSREKVCYDCGKLVDIAKKKHKYGAEKTVVDGVTFASKKEALRYDYLKTMFFYGKIASLELQPRYKLEVNGVLICIYKGDFRYVELSNLETVVEDVKGFKTPAYRLKKKLMLAIHGIEIFEV